MKNYEYHLDKRIVIYQKNGLADGGGGTLANWKTKEGYTLLKKRWADVMTLSDKSLYEARMAQEETTHSVIIRFNQKIFDSKPSTLVISYQGRKLEVETITDIQEEKKYIKLRCKETYGKNKR